MSRLLTSMIPIHTNAMRLHGMMSAADVSPTLRYLQDSSRPRYSKYNFRPHSTNLHRQHSTNNLHRQHPILRPQHSNYFRPRSTNLHPRHSNNFRPHSNLHPQHSNFRHFTLNNLRGRTPTPLNRRSHSNRYSRRSHRPFSITNRPAFHPCRQFLEPCHQLDCRQSFEHRRHTVPLQLPATPPFNSY
jgi:hypothetical protein